MIHTKFHGNRSTGSREEDFWRVFTIYGAWRPCWSCDQHHVNIFSFPCILKLAYKIWLWLASGFWEKQVLSFVCKWHWPRSRNDLDHQYTHLFIFSVGFRSQATYSEKSRSTQGHHLNKLWWAGVTNATYQVSWKSVHRFGRRRFLKGFYHIWAWRPCWSCDPDAANKLSSPLPKEAPH